MMLDDIQKCFGVGSRIELVLFEGVEYDSGISPGGIRQRGYVAGNDVTSLAGPKATGYIVRFEKHKLILAPVWHKERACNDVFYFEDAVIHSVHA
ncbi:MAG: hypothetical protein HY363_00275 [Candidatus Aenigmarchaeota archaeon]|nr:hypothetical protein [Candidatus Aenigmarchaeota archaeon]